MVVEEPRPRLCHVTKWANFEGYGFNLHAERNKPGQYIGKVDLDSPAKAAGLQEGDKIIEVNGVNINQENHKQVVQRIKSNPSETRLLVVDSATESYHKEKNVIITGKLPYIQYLSSDKHFETIDTRIQEEDEGRDSPDSENSIEEKSTKNEIIRQDSGHPTVDREDSLVSERTLSHRSSVSSNGKERNSLSSGSPRSTPSPSRITPSPTLNPSGLDLPLTAREMRERILSKKKKDPRREDRMDFRKKYDIVQTL